MLESDFRSMWLFTGRGWNTKARECAVVDSIELFSRQVVDEIGAGEMEDSGAQRSSRGMKKTGLERFYYRGEFR